MVRRLTFLSLKKNSDLKDGPLFRYLLLRYRSVRSPFTWGSTSRKSHPRYPMTWGRRSPLRVVPRRTPTESTSHPRRNVDDPSGSTFGLPSCCETRGTVEGGRRSRLLRSSLSFADEIGLVFWDRDFTESRRRRPRGPGSTLCRSRDGPRGGE